MDRSGANTRSRIFRTYWALDTYRIKGNEGSMGDSKPSTDVI